MIIIVDQNEKDTNPEVVASIKRHFTNVIVTNLPHHEHGGTRVTAGDVNLPLDDGNLLAIERKTPTDFVQSIFSGHLFDQVEIMAQHAKYSAVIVTGRFTYTEKSDIVRIDDNREYPKWKGAAVRGAITTLQYSACPVIFCPPNKYCQMIFEVFNTVNKQDARQTVKKNRIITFPPVDNRVEFIAQLPGTGFELSLILLLLCKFLMQSDFFALLLCCSCCFDLFPAICSR